jgi:hypothetical protein
MGGKPGYKNVAGLHLLIFLIGSSIIPYRPFLSQEYGA